ncbi:hypothetical protein Pla52n_21720 [Stieleria varia]|uniref:Protein containing DUF1549 n=2 Tax=Stieleria varia TaxID=2528005 RepID=A0A5C6B4P6_9BACT|nr:hypothetical protein Pla52n_21720 [Stieleria varia]
MFATAVRWGWFGFLVLGVFGYMASGLSTTDSPTEDFGLDRSTDSSTPLLDSDASVQSVALELRTWRDAMAQRVDRVNTVRNRELDRLGQQSADPADWMTVCRRLSLALVGSGMSLEDIRTLQQLPEDVREAAYVQRLLDDKRFHDYWAERWTRSLVGTENGPFVVFRRRRFRYWLAEQIAANEPYDKIVSDLITAEGLWTDQPQVNFLTVTFDSNDGQPDPIRLAARTSRAFLGLRIDCLQCHDDFLGNVSLGDIQSPRAGAQSDFHQLAAFFSSAKNSGLQGVRTGDAEYQYQYLNATEEVAVEPAVPYSPELMPADGDVREQLAGWVTHPDNKPFSRAAVSRVWALMFGRAASGAIDDLPLDADLPPMLEQLADDFSKDFDLRRLIRTIAASDAFRADSRASFVITQAHEDSTAAFPLVRLRPEQVAGSIIQSSRIKSVDRDSSFFVQLQKFGSTNDFLERYGDMGEDEFKGGSITITQRLTMINGNMLRESIGSNPIMNASAHIDMFSADDETAVDNVYLCVLNRHPTGQEREHFAGRLASADQRSQAIEDLYWVLLNSTELAWNH